MSPVVPMCLMTMAAFASTGLAQQHYYRPLSLQDMVDAVGTNAEGMPDDELSRQVSTYALHISDNQGVGVSARFTDDPDGAIIVGWRVGDRLWRHAWVDEDQLGRLEAFRPVGAFFVVETRHADQRTVTALLDAALATVAVVDGRVTAVQSGSASGTALTVTVQRGAGSRTLTCAAVTDTPRRHCADPGPWTLDPGPWTLDPGPWTSGPP